MIIHASPTNINNNNKKITISNNKKIITEFETKIRLKWYSAWLQQ